MKEKWVKMAFEASKKGRYELLSHLYAHELFSLPIFILREKIKEDLDLDIAEHSLYNLRRRLKAKVTSQGKTTDEIDTSNSTLMPVLNPASKASSPESSSESGAFHQALESIKKREDAQQPKTNTFNLDE